MDSYTFQIRIEKRWVRTAMIVIVTALAAGPVAAYAAHRFTDVSDSNTFHDDIAWLADAGVTRGCNPPDNTRFCPSDNVTRGQMAAFLHRLAENQVVDAGELDGQDSMVFKNVLAMSTHSVLTDPLGVLAPGTHELASVQIDVPGSGVILFQAASSWQQEGGADSNLLQWLDFEAPDPCGSDFGPNDDDALGGSIAEVWMDGDDQFDAGTAVSISSAVVAESGTYVAHSCAAIETGPIRSIDRTIVAEWYPQALVNSH